MLTMTQLESLPLLHRETIPTEYLDIMGHMNVRWYAALFDSAAWKLFESFGMDQNYYRNEQAGGFALKQFVQFIAEVRVGQTIALRGRILGRSAKRIHFILFMVNETTNVLAATMEGLGSHADMRIRRTSPYPAQLAAKIDAMLAEHQTLDWDAPVCGVIQP